MGLLLIIQSSDSYLPSATENRPFICTNWSESATQSFRMSGLYDYDFIQKDRTDTPISGRLQLPALERHPRKRRNPKSPSLPKGVVLQSGRYRVTLTKYVPRQRPEQYCLGTYDSVEEASDVRPETRFAFRAAPQDPKTPQK